MKNIFFTIIAGLGLVACGKMARAQTDEKPIPKAPYIAAVPDYGHWTVTFKYSGPTSTGTGGDAKPPAAPAGSPMLIDTIKTGELRGVFITFADGTIKQYTCQGDWVLASGEKGAQLRIATKSLRPYAYYTTGFVLLDGVKIDQSVYKETAMHDGTLAFHYKSGQTDVWIDPATMYPVTVKTPDIEVTYQFLPPPPKPFDIPKDQADLMKKEQDADKAVRSMR